MRMSSGASKRKLMPRDGSSSCGDDTPMSSRTPSTCEMLSDRQHLVQPTEGGMYEREARVRDGRAGGDRHRIAIQRNQSSLRTQLRRGWRGCARRARRSHRRRGRPVGSPALPRPRSAAPADGLRVSSRSSVPVTGRCPRIRGAARSPARASKAVSCWRRQPASLQISKCEPMPTSQTCLSSSAVSRSSGATGCGRRIDFTSRALPTRMRLSAAERGSKLGAARILSRIGCPGGFRIEQQATMRMGGQDQPTLTGRHQGIAMPGRNRQPSFRIQIELRRPLEHSAPSPH